MKIEIGYSPARKAPLLPTPARTLVLAVLASACASVPPKAAPVTSVEQRCEAILSALHKDQLGVVVETFDDVMARLLSAHQLRQVWRGIVDNLGALESWRPKESAASGGKQVRVYTLVFQRGQARALLTVDPGSLQLAGLFFQPAEAE